MITFPHTLPVTCHTKFVGPGSTFVAIKGFNEDGITYIPQAIAKGARHIVVGKNAELTPEIKSLIEQYGCTIDCVENTRRALAQLSAQAWGYPAKHLKIIGITGTKGKTTSAFLLEHVLKEAGYRTALVSTVYNKINDIQFPMQLTTPQPDYLHAFFALCDQEKVDYVVMETAAQAFTMDRLYGIEFDGALFTNFSQEHAEFYANQQEYFDAKCNLIKQCKSGAPIIINADDARCASLKKQQPTIKSFGIKNIAEYQAQPNTNVNFVSFALTHTESSLQYTCPALLGNFNVYNVLGVVSLSLELGLESHKIQHALQTFSKVPGRMETYTLHNGAHCIIDYAHNPSSYQAVLSTVRSMTNHLIVVFGCGGERDHSKRPIMGEIAARFADVVILTSDNPRSEDPQNIITMIMSGIDAEYQHKVHCELDRKKAIERAYSMSRKESLIMLLGKGPDEYQQIGTVKYPFSEAQIIQGLGA